MNIINYVRYTDKRIKYYHNLWNFMLNFINIFQPNLDNDEVCSICYDKGCDTVLPCKHTYHLKCILKWFRTKKYIECPYCRENHTYLLVKDL